MGGLYSAQRRSAGQPLDEFVALALSQPGAKVASLEGARMLAGFLHALLQYVNFGNSSAPGGLSKAHGPHTRKHQTPTKSGIEDRIGPSH